MKFDSSVSAIVTGGASGLGAATVKALRDLGVKVAIFDLNPETGAGMTAHPMYDQFKSMSVKQLQPMASDQITDAGIAKLTAELAALK